MGRGENEGFYMLPEIVCKAIPDPSLDLTSDERKKLSSGGASGQQYTAISADVIWPEFESNAEEPPQKNAG